jgi:hypothetical protein
MPSKAAGSISSASTSMPSTTRGPAREQPGSVDGEHAVVPDRPQLPSPPAWRPRPLGDRVGEPEPAGHEHEDLRGRPRRGPPTSSRRSAALLPSSSQPPARRTCSGTQWPTANGGSSHSIAATRGGTNPWSRRPTTISSTACSRSRSPRRRRRRRPRPRHRPDGLDRVEDPLHGDGLEADHGDVAVEPCGPPR